MLSLNNKQVLLGVSGGIAAYKSADLVRRLRDLGADVRVVMTKGAQEFITPMTLQALSGRPVHTELLDADAEAAMGHIELARWADLILIAPATANLMASIAMGRGDDLLTTLCLATRSPIAIAPAMNQAMWADLATQDNLNTLMARSIHVFGPGSGQQACGDIGLGRMLEPAEIAAMAGDIFKAGSLQGKGVVITAGPTQEAIDPVRYISNHSSGKMGYALAQAAVEAGASVTLITGPCHLTAPERVKLVRVVTAEQMCAAAEAAAQTSDIFIGAAAVADFKPKHLAAEKLKKGESDVMTIEMVKNPDVIATVAKLKARPFCVGFAAETNNVTEYAAKKLKSKNLDLIIANDVSDKNIGFNSDENAVVVMDGAAVTHFSQQSKTLLARDLIKLVAEKLTSTK